MTDPEVGRAATFLAAHAVLLLGIGVLTALASLAAVVGVIHVLRRYRDGVRRAFASLVRQARAVGVIDRAITRTTTLVPSGYLALHLTLGLVLTGAAAVFVAIAEDVIGGGEIAAFDLAFARALKDTASPRWEQFFATVSWLGEREAIAAATLIVAVALLRRHGTLLAAGWVAAQAGGGLLNLALKSAFTRTRPEFADPLLAASSWSFPSGHAMGTFILCGLGSYLLLRDVRAWTTSGLVVAMSLSWCVVMAFSRLYLGVHFASDVIAGICAGAAWVAVCASAFEVIRRKGT
jgi:membrane-associated phospholipid phosphatase